MFKKNKLVTILILVCVNGLWAQPEETIYDEAMVPKFELPDVLVLENGKKVDNKKTWEKKRRKELVKLFEDHVYGRVPKKFNNKKLRFETLSYSKMALQGRATRKEIRVYFAPDTDTLYMDILIYLPNHIKDPVPAFLTLNFRGNHTIADDPCISLTRSWIVNVPEYGIRNNVAVDSSRGMRKRRWAISKILERGYALATIYYGDIDPDFDDGFKNGVHAIGVKNGKPDQGDWGSIATWAWGLSRGLDVLIKDKKIDAKRVIVMGHSRLGKTSLWAGAMDERFALVISNNSGCGGAALSRRAFGETVARINSVFPHWFCDRFNEYNNNEDACPVDQHMLISLVAPRPVYIASASEDLWADPRGEFLSCVYADPVYRLFGLEGMPDKEMPPLNKSVGGSIGYHIREGKHDVTDFDWEKYMDFADRHLK